jgi:hypothetical protein
LEALELTEAKLSAAILPQLQALPKLAKLRIETVDISAEDVAKLQAGLPQVKIDHRPLSLEDRENTLVKKLRIK